MTFKEFLNIYGNSMDCEDVARSMSFDPVVVSMKEFIILYHKAVRLRLTPDNAAEIFMKRFNVDWDCNIDAAEEGLSLTDYYCKHDPYSIVNAEKNAGPNSSANPSPFTTASPITKADLEKYKMPYIVDESEEDKEP